MNKLFLECSSCHHIILPDPEKIPILVEILGSNKLYKCKSCGSNMDFYSIHICSRNLGHGMCSTCNFRFLCYTNDAIEKA